MPNPLVYTNTDFTTSGGVIDTEQLRQEMANASLGSVNFVGIICIPDVSPFTCSIYFDGIPDASDESTTDGIVAAHDALGPVVGTFPLESPVLTTTERDALTPSNGLMIYNSTTNTFQFYENGTWVNRGTPAVHASTHAPGGSDALSTAAPSIGIGASNSEGVATSFARSDHNHTLRTGSTDLTVGAIADGQTLIRSGSSIVGSTPSGTGDVVGPASATDNAVARFDTATGKLIQNSVVLIGDTGAITGVLTINGVTVENHSARHDPGGADALTTAAPSIGIGAGNTEGSASSFARSDHNHALRTGATDLTIGTITDGEALVRSGTTIASQAFPTDFLDSAFRISDNVDNTKKLAFETSGITTATTRTITVPDADITVDDASSARTPTLHASTHNPGGGDALATAAPSIGIGASNSEGVATSFARSDHNHTLRTGTTDLTIGAIADGEHVVRSGTTLVGTSAGTGDVVGPASATDNAVARFDTATGKLIQNSVVLIGDTGAVTGVLTINGVTVENHSARHDPGGADALTTAAPSVGIGAANSEGSASSFARSDHNHALRTGATDLTIGTITDGEVLVRSGTTIASQTLPNDFLDSVFRVSDNVDNTKKLAFEISGVTTATTRTITVPDADITVDDASSARTPTSHASTHNPGGGDALSTAAPSIGIGASNSEGVATSFARSDHNHTIRTGATDLTIGAIADGEHVVRSGTTLVGTSAGAGDVVGPISATDNAVARFDTATGKLIQNSVVLIGDTGAITGVLTINGVTVENHSARHDPGGADALTTAAPSIGIGAGNSEGVATSFARSDHNHTLRTGVTDLTIGAISDGQMVTRSGTALVGAAIPTAPVDSVFGRTGAVVAAASDYDAVQVDFDNTGTGLGATDVQGALNAVITALATQTVVGPVGGSTDNAVARFDTTTGLLIQNSVVLIGDTGAITGVLTINGVTIENHSARHDPGGADALTTAAPSIGIGASNSEGVATSYARSDHNHTLRTGTTDLTIGTIADGGVVTRSGTSLVSAQVAHSALSGLTSGDDHTQYALLAGRAGGQTITGDTAASGDLTLRSTSNATKGSVILDTGTDLDASGEDIRNIATATFEGPVTQTTSGSTLTIDLSAGNKHRITLASNITTVSLTAPPGAGNFILEFVQNATGSFTVTGWPAAVLWPSGTAPTFGDGANALRIVSLYYNGATEGDYYGEYRTNTYS